MNDQDLLSHHPKVFEPTLCWTAEEAYLRICEIYYRSASLIQQSFAHFAERHVSQESLTPEELQELRLHQAPYPYVGFTLFSPTSQQLEGRELYGISVDPGVYGTTVTRPDIFKDYYLEQLDMIVKAYQVPLVVGASEWPIPLPFVVDPSTRLGSQPAWQLPLAFALPDLSRVDDSVSNCTFSNGPSGVKPLALFTAERIDYSLQRLHHYTGTAPEHFQRFILLTNYQRYIDEFIEYGLEQLVEGEEYEAFVQPADIITHNPRLNLASEPKDPPLHLPQMPAYHLKRADGNGVTFINIGVGPSNAKTITDHLAVLRPHCWLMLGHCAGLRRSQLLGDYVLAHGYVREDQVLNQDLPAWVPIPPIAEVQVSLQEAVSNITGRQGIDLKKRVRTGTVFTTDNRNWELRTHELFERFNQSRAIAVDMESATIAANGFRFRVPYGTLLCVSDKPIHGEIKLRGMANKFYQESVNQHLKIGLEAIRLLREGGVEQLHSRKLRGFNEPPFR